MSVTPLQRVSATADMLPFKASCERLGFHYNTGYRLHKEGRFPVDVVVMGKRFFCRRVDIDRWTRRAS